MASLCGKCGSEVPSDKQFCGTCGTPASGSAAAVSQPQPVAVPAASGSGSAVKIILIIVAVFVGLGIIGAGIIGYGVWRVSRAIHMNGRGGQVTLSSPTGGGTVTVGSTEAFTPSELATDIYPGAEPGKGGMRMTLPTGSMVAGVFVTNDSKDQVVAFYKNKFGSDASLMETGNGAILTLAKGPQESVMVTITEKSTESNGKTQIHIVHTIGKKTP